MRHHRLFALVNGSISPTAERRILLSILAFAAILRLVMAPFITARLGYLPDVLSYRTAASELLSSGGIVSTYLMPGYPILVWLAGGGGAGQLVADVIVSVVSVWCVAAIVRTLTGDALSGLLAAFLWAIYPFSIFYAIVGLSENLFVALILLGFLAYQRGYFSWGSLAMVASILTRPTVEILTPILILFFALVIHRLSVARTLRHLGIFAALYVVLMSPWWWHNYQKYGEFVRLDTAGGMVLYSGNNPNNHDGGGVAVKVDVPGYRDAKGPVEQDHLLRQAAVRFIVENPGRFIELAVIKFMRLWRPWPYASEYSGLFLSVVSAASYLPVLVLALVGTAWAVRRRDLRVVPIILFIGYTTAIHMLTIGSLRYRFPMEPFLVILAAPPLAWIVRKLLPARPAAAV